MPAPRALINALNVISLKRRTGAEGQEQKLLHTWSQRSNIIDAGRRTPRGSRQMHYAVRNPVPLPAIMTLVPA